MPPIEASAPGSIGKNKPSALTASLTALRVTPGCTVTVKSSALTRSTWFMRLTSMLMPPWMASKWPSKDEPTPNGMTGVLYCAASLTAAATSAVDSAKTTALGGGTVNEDSSLPWCSRTASAVEQRSPNNFFSASINAGGVLRWTTAGNTCEVWVGAFMVLNLHLFLYDKMASVMRETQHISPASLLMSICQTCVVRPMCTG